MNKWLVMMGFVVWGSSTEWAAAQPPAMIHYQGRLLNGTNLMSGVEQLDFRLFTAPTGGTLLFHASDNVNLVDGLYDAVIGETVIAGNLHNALSRPEVWLEIEVVGTPLTPRERLLSVPYARQVHGLTISTNNSVVVSGNGSSSAFASALAATISGGSFNVVTGNYGVVGGGLGNLAGAGSTVAGGQFNQAPEPFATISGGSENSAGVRAVVGGGQLNEATGDFSVIGGGENNLADDSHSVVGGGQGNQTDVYGVVGGGLSNRIVSAAAVIGGGALNTINSESEGDVIAGGLLNLVSGDAGTIGGGFSNRVLAALGVIPGGRENLVTGDYSFAGGRRAWAGHPYSFVWAGQETGHLSTTASNQFIVQANGGFGIGVAPSYSLHLRATTPSMMLENTGNTPVYLRFKRAADGANDHYIAIGSAGQMVTRVAGADRMTITTAGRVGIGTPTPDELLHVDGNVQADSFFTSSDRNLKENIVPVEPATILEKVETLPVATWSFRDEPGATHIGPMAQDFHAAFGFGNSDTSIATVDADGVALAAIQALAKKVRALEEQNIRLQAELEALKQPLR